MTVCEKIIGTIAHLKYGIKHKVCCGMRQHKHLIQVIRLVVPVPAKIENQRVYWNDDIVLKRSNIWIEGILSCIIGLTESASYKCMEEADVLEVIGVKVSSLPPVDFRLHIFCWKVKWFRYKSTGDQMKHKVEY